MVSICLSTPALADFIIINNPGFENPILSDGLTSGTSTPSWSRIGAATFLNPSTSHFVGGLASEGSNVATLSAAGSGQSISQDLASTTLQYGTYTFEFDVGDRLDQTFHNVNFNFLVNSTTIIPSSSFIAPTVPDGEFITWTFNYQILDSGVFSGLIGDPTRIRFTAFGSSGGFSIDNVRGSFTAVPEPTSFVAIWSVLVFVRTRRRFRVN